MATNADNTSTPQRTGQGAGGGPRTPEGKARSRENSFKHGSCTRTMRLVGDEKEDDYEKFSVTWFNRLSPQDAAEHQLVVRIVDAAWRTRRAECNLQQVESEIYNACPYPSQWTEDHHRMLERFQRYVTTETNRFHRAQHMLEGVRKSERRDAASWSDALDSALNDVTGSPEALKGKEIAEQALRECQSVDLTRDDGGCTCFQCAWCFGIERRQNERNAVEEACRKALALYLSKDPVLKR